MAARTGALAGGFAAALATVAMLLLRLLADVPSLPELVQEWITTWLPVQALGAYLGAFGGAAKLLAFALLFAGGLAGGALVGALLGAAWGSPPPPPGRLVVQGLLAGLGLCVATVVVLRPLGPIVGIAAPFLLFGLLLPLCYRWLTQAETTRQPARPAAAAAPAPRAPVAGAAPGDSRRLVLERLGWGAVAVAGAVALWRFVGQSRDLGLGTALGMGQSPGSRGTRRDDEGDHPEVTPTADFYVVSKNLRDPRPDLEAWRLHVNGLVARPVALTLDDVRAMPQREQWQSLICISNPVGGDFAGNALWRGIPVADLLALTVGFAPKASRVVFRAADNYSDSLPLAKALDPGTMVALAMNGEDLPLAHGAPARLLVPGHYGIKHVKWLNSLEVVDTTYRGYWQRRGWSDTAVIKTTSRIDFPRRGTVTAAQATRIAGMAYAGDRGVSRVEVSEDDGQTWRPASLIPPRGPFSWVFWEAPWAPDSGRQYQLTVRALDGRGDLQTSEDSPALPDGSTGFHTVTVRVS
jgi:DMSO/TMAO reductase YedYZ molybdopterin-dependent catalytic subunit